MLRRASTSAEYTSAEYTHAKAKGVDLNNNNLPGEVVYETVTSEARILECLGTLGLYEVFSGCLAEPPHGQDTSREEAADLFAGYLQGGGHVVVAFITVLVPPCNTCQLLQCAGSDGTQPYLVAPCAATAPTQGGGEQLCVGYSAAIEFSRSDCYKARASDAASGEDVCLDENYLSEHGMDARTAWCPPALPDAMACTLTQLWPPLSQVLLRASKSNSDAIGFCEKEGFRVLELIQMNVQVKLLDLESPVEVAMVLMCQNWKLPEDVTEPEQAE
eukprot:gene169-363_t